MSNNNNNRYMEGFRSGAGVCRGQHGTNFAEMQAVGVKTIPADAARLMSKGIDPVGFLARETDAAIEEAKRQIRQIHLDKKRGEW